jgi:3-dehydroquinate dehydratase II
VKRIAVANGPNLNLLGTREPEIYGKTTLAEIENQVRARAEQLGAAFVWFQSNHEGALIDWLQQNARGATGLILNPGALTHYSYALYDCLRALGTPIVEVHLTNLHGRPEPFRHVSVTAPAAVGVISGLGPRGYVLAMEYLVDLDQ